MMWRAAGEQLLMEIMGNVDCHAICRLYRRQSTADGIGYTAHLTGDNHRHGLVHWTGFPSEYLFVLTRNVVTGTSRESWLWR